MSHDDEIDDAPTLASTRSADAATPPPVPAWLGPYRITGLLGEGGMARVYLAEQTEPVRRRVAVKALRPGFDSRHVLARFESERQALAVLQHPGIARIYDGGATADGISWFAMEWVRGAPITAFCDDRQLSIARRIELFVQVCEAVQHAHQKGLIHRDLKPSNLLVEDDDGRFQAKVIDFGVAKAIGADLSDRTLLTEVGQVIGTPHYMSPEQVDSTARDVDTRADIFSLGVVLYELLVGARPRDLPRERSALLGSLRTGTAPSLTTRLTQLGGDQARIARARSTSLATLRRTLQGDLDWIVRKALEHERSRRYASASELARDCRRFLAGEPVIARPPSATYVLTRFVQRNRVAVGAAAAVLVAVLAGSALATVGLLRALEAERIAHRQAQTAERVLDFMVEVFEVSDPRATHGEAVTARELLERGESRITQALAEEPAIRATLFDTIGRVYKGLGLYDRAEERLRQSLALREAAGAGEAVDTASTLVRLADVYNDLDRFAEGSALAERALAIVEARLGPAHPQTTRALTVLAALQIGLGDYARAEALFRRVLDLQRDSLGEAHPAIGETLDNLGVTLVYRGRFAEAEDYLRRALALRERLLGGDDADTAATLNNLATLLAMQDRTNEAEPLLRRSLQIHRSVYAQDHPLLAFGLNNLATNLLQQERYDEAEGLLREALAVTEQAFGPDHGDNAIHLNNLAYVYHARGEPERAEPLYRRSLAITRAAYGPGHRNVGATLSNLGRVYLDQGKLAEAESTLAQALAIAERDGGPRHPDVADYLHHLGNVSLAAARHEEAEARLVRALSIREEVLGRDHRRTGETLRALATLRRRQGRPEAARPLEARALKIFVTHLGEDHRQTRALRAAMAQDPAGL